MDVTEIRNTVFEELRNIAPEAEPEMLDEAADMREALDLDSIDFLNLIIALNTRLGVAIADRDYDQLYTLGGLLEYLQRRLR